MTDTRDQIEMLRALLPEIEGGEGALADEDLGRLLCALHNLEFISATRAPTHHGWLAVHGRKWPEPTSVEAWARPFDRRPDTDLQAADDLVREVLPPEWKRSSGDSENGFCCELFTVIDDDRKVPSLDGIMENCERYIVAKHPTSEPRAILAALVRAKIAELEVKDAQA